MVTAFLLFVFTGDTSKSIDKLFFLFKFHLEESELGTRTTRPFQFHRDGPLPHVAPPKERKKSNEKLNT